MPLKSGHPGPGAAERVRRPPTQRSAWAAGGYRRPRAEAKYTVVLAGPMAHGRSVQLGDVGRARESLSKETAKETAQRSAVATKRACAWGRRAATDKSAGRRGVPRPPRQRASRRKASAHQVAHSQPPRPRAVPVLRRSGGRSQGRSWASQRDACTLKSEMVVRDDRHHTQQKRETPTVTQGGCDAVRRANLGAATAPQADGAMSNAAAGWRTNQPQRVQRLLRQALPRPGGSDPPGSHRQEMRGHVRRRGRRHKPGRAQAQTWRCHAGRRSGHTRPAAL